MERPKNVSLESWEALTEQEQEFLAEHERLHTGWEAELHEFLTTGSTPSMFAWRQVKHRTVQ